MPAPADGAHAMAPHRDPVTGQFTGTDDMDSFDDVEVATAQTVVAGDPTSTLGADFPSELRFENLELVDYDDIVDRNESLHLLRAQHALVVFARGNAGAPGAVRGTVEISTSPSRQVAGNMGSTTNTTLSATQNNLGGGGTRSLTTDDSIDLIGRVLEAGAEVVHQDVGSSTASGASRSADRYTADGFPAEVGRFHPRDELFANGVIEADGVDVEIYAAVNVQHVYGVLEE